MLYLDGKIEVRTYEYDFSDGRKKIMDVLDLLDNCAKIFVSGKFVARDTKEVIEEMTSVPVVSLGYKFFTIVTSEGMIEEVSILPSDDSDDRQEDDNYYGRCYFTIEGMFDRNDIWSDENFTSIATKYALSLPITLTQIYEMANEGKSLKQIKEELLKK